MARNILNFPREILDACLEELLPSFPTDAYALVQDMDHLPTPEDLCMLMLVCKAFKYLALPWVWRRAAIILTEGFRSELRGRGRQRTAPGQWSYLCAHPEVAAYVRVLNVSFHDCGPGALTRALTSLHPAIKSMHNLRILKFSVRGFRPLDRARDILDETYTEFISKPLLDTLITSYDAPSSGGPRSLPSLKRLASLHGYRDRPESRLLGVTISGLESLAIFGGHCDFLALPIPWDTLHDIKLNHDDGWHAVIDNFSVWKETYTRTLSPLAEIFIDDADISYDQFARLLVVFRGQRITTLSLSRIESIDKTLLDNLVESFPHLQKLSLSTDYDFMNWDIELSIVVASLERLEMLKSLDWNYINQDFDYETDENVQEIFRKIIPIIGKRCRTLECVRFNDSDRTFSYRFERNNLGQYKESLEEELPSHYAFPHFAYSVFNVS